MNFSHYIIEGCDRLSKSTLAQAIKNQYGFFQVIHYTKPEILKYYETKVSNNTPDYCYQIDSFNNGFKTLANPAANYIFDRFTLGESVYAPRYRHYSGEYIFNLEAAYNVSEWDHVCLVLLTTSDWSFIHDDGESFDFSRKEEEQASFITAFDKSIFKHKIIIDVAKDGFYKDPKDILAEITRGTAND